MHDKQDKSGCEKCVCEKCCAEIPLSAAVTAEGADYVHHFCGQACYDKWRSQYQSTEEK